MTLREQIAAVDFLWDVPCWCDFRRETPDGLKDGMPHPDCYSCGHALDLHPNGWTCTAIVRKPKNPKVLRDEILALIPSDL